MAWLFERETRRYRSTETGRFLSHDAALQLRDKFTDARKQTVRALATELKSGALDLAGWERRMREEIKVSHLAQSMLGRGGRQQMTPSDWGRCGQAIRAQYGFLGQFADAAAGLSEAQVAARSALYVEAGTASFERAQAAAWGVELPAHPASGDTICGVSCRCAWSIVEEDGQILATWELGGAEACADCEARAATWAPLVFAREAVAA